MGFEKPMKDRMFQRPPTSTGPQVLRGSDVPKAPGSRGEPREDIMY
jgi:hypothetical protein